MTTLARAQWLDVIPAILSLRSVTERPPPAGTDVPRAPSNVDLHHRTNLDRAAELNDRARGGDLRRLIQIAGLDQRIAANDVLRLSKRAIGDHLAPSTDDFPRLVERLTDILETALAVHI